MKSIYRRFFPLLLSLGLGSVAPCMAEESLLLVTGQGYPPFADASLPNGGLATELISRTLDHLERPYKLAFEPWKRGYQLTVDGIAFATFPYFRDAEREQQVNFSQPLFRLSNVLFVNSKNPSAIRSVTDIPGKRLCLPDGYTAVAVQPWLDEGVIDLYRGESLTHCFTLLSLMRVDGVPISDAVGWAAIRDAHLSESDFRQAEITFSENWLHLVVGKNTPDGTAFLKAFNEAWNALVSSGAFDDTIRLRAGNQYADEFARYAR